MTSNSNLRTDTKHIRYRKAANWFSEIKAESKGLDKPILK